MASLTSRNTRTTSNSLSPGSSKESFPFESTAPILWQTPLRRTRRSNDGRSAAECCLFLKNRDLRSSPGFHDVYSKTPACVQLLPRRGTLIREGHHLCFVILLFYCE